MDANADKERGTTENISCVQIVQNTNEQLGLKLQGE